MKCLAGSIAKGNNGKGEAMKSFVRPTLPQDMLEIWEMLQDVSTFYPRIQAPDLFETLRKEKGFHSLVAEQNGHIVGFGSLITYRRIRGGKVGQIEDLVVKYNERGHGIGSQILDDLLGLAWSHNCFKVSLSCIPENVEFYAAAGFMHHAASLSISNPRQL